MKATPILFSLIAVFCFQANAQKLYDTTLDAGTIKLEYSVWNSVHKPDFYSVEFAVKGNGKAMLVEFDLEATDGVNTTAKHYEIKLKQEEWVSPHETMMTSIPVNRGNQRLKSVKLTGLKINGTAVPQKNEPRPYRTKAG